VVILNFMAVKILPKGGRVLGDLEHQSTCKSYHTMQFVLGSTTLPQTIYVDKFLSSAFILRSQTGPNSVLLVFYFKLNCFCFGKNLLCLYI